jgi:PTH1 family peptidyl-tRNA hydrolase
MKLVVGLGNPGLRYAGTRHNAGFLIAERFAADRGIALAEERFQGRFGSGFVATGGGASRVEVGVLEPATYMNCSGAAVAEAVAELPVDDPCQDLLIVLDDMDLPFGRLRLRPAGGPGGHRGLSDILERFRSQEIPRLRFGVGRPREEAGAVEHVLQRFSLDEERRLPAQIERAARAVEVALLEGVTPAMNVYNRDPASEDDAGDGG